ncbi:MAG: RebB family R body protein [Caulobacter sp.]|jgi:hypothetical protein|nr:RebB family R body protein [Caulobacter sp.]
MPDSSAVNSQVTDSVTQANVKVLAEAPAIAMGSLYQTIGNSVAMAAANAVYAQQQANVTYQAATTLAVEMLINGPGGGATANRTLADVTPPSPAAAAGGTETS